MTKGTHLLVDGKSAPEWELALHDEDVLEVIWPCSSSNEHYHSRGHFISCFMAAEVVGTER
jgi:hypothetical protein